MAKGDNWNTYVISFKRIDIHKPTRMANSLNKQKDDTFIGH